MTDSKNEEQRVRTYVRKEFLANNQGRSAVNLYANTQQMVRNAASTIITSANSSFCHWSSTISFYILRADHDSRILWE